MRIIDLEAHCFTPEYIKYMRSRKDTPRLESMTVNGKKIEGIRHVSGNWETRGPVFDRLSDLDDIRIKDMDRDGVTMQVLTLGGPGVEQFQPDEATDVAHRVNDELAAAMKRHPGRYSAFATLAAQDPEKAADELERCVTKLGFLGGKINSHVRGGDYLDDKKYWGIWDRAAKLGVPIYLHPRLPSPQMIKAYMGYDGALTGASLGFAAEALLHSMRLIMSGLFDKYPDLRIMLGHLGESLPFWLQRINMAWRMKQTEKLGLKHMASDYVKANFLVTPSGMPFMPAFLCTYMALGADAILFAVDYPFESNKEHIQLIANAPICDGDKEKIFHGNAERILKLK